MTRVVDALKLLSLALPDRVELALEDVVAEHRDTVGPQELPARRRRSALEARPLPLAALVNRGQNPVDGHRPKGGVHH